MAGAVHGGGEADAVINVGVSGPGVMAAALEKLPDSASMMEVAEKIKQTAFKITRAGELMSREAAIELGVEGHRRHKGWCHTVATKISTVEEQSWRST